MKAIAFYPQIAEVVGIEAALFFQQICYWSPKAKRSDGFFYKSADEFKKETSLTEKQQRLCRTILEKKGWIAAKKIMANGHMTWHYKALMTIELAVVPTGERPVYQLAKGQPQLAKGQFTTSKKASSITGEYQKSTSVDVSPLPPLEDSPQAEGREDPPVPPTPPALVATLIAVKESSLADADMSSIIQNAVETSEAVQMGIALGLDKERAVDEFKRFYLHWTEKSPKGRKARWEMEKTFDVKRRLYTWFSNRVKWDKEKQGEKRGQKIEGVRMLRPK